ncbi:MAG: MBL fold metallo-hydrolase [Leptospiraceae bacterium]|nr:MBL fold metallo-hydrolase [Leptospiraceae bacterium]MCP5501221.1 MBL fold metallo-hydrolase [Leptospiraceae bacterium]
MEKLNYEDAIPIMEGIYWIGFKERSTKLHCNPYLLVDTEDVLVFDPGSIPDFPVIMRKIIETIPPERITHLVLSHQDPDVCGNIAVMEDVIGNDNLQIVCHINTLRLVRHTGVKSTFYDTCANQNLLTLKSGRRIEFIPAPFLHAPGTIMTYDHKTKTLFSGDIFGGIGDDWSLYITENYKEEMKLFHQAYMPSNRIMKKKMEELEKYEIRQILPQHGSIIPQKYVKEAIAYLKELPLAIDLLDT